MNVALTEAEVTAHCERAGVSISAIESLPFGGSHLVTTTSEGAAEMRNLLAKHLIEGPVRRFAYMPPPSTRQEVPAQLSAKQKGDRDKPQQPPLPWFRLR